MSPDQRREELYRREAQEAERRRAASVRRGPIGLVVVCLVVALGVGITAAVDLRRLQTPRGTALAWTGAVVFGDCTAFRRLTAGPQGDAATQCRELRSSSDAARERPSGVDFSVVQVEQQGRSAQARVRLRRPDRPAVDIPVTLRRDGARWRVELTTATCAQLACPGAVDG